MSLKISFWDTVISKYQSVGPRTLLLYLHIAVLLIALWSLCIFSFIILTTDIDFSRDIYFKQGFENKEFLLSVWATFSHIIYFGTYSLIDIIAICAKKSERALKIRKILYNVADYFLFSLVFPLTAVTSFLFWALYYWDKEHMYPKQLDMFPDYLNHMMHTYPLPAIILYMFTHVRKEPNKYKTLPPLIFLLIVYNQLIFSIRRTKGVWVYPVFEFLTFSQVQGIAAFTLIASIVCHFLGYYLFNILKGIRSSIDSKLKEMEKMSALRQKKQ
ncbi:unnamed protein product [Nezara viridula]|uniref:Uncharacterized protein n=1 Tax=Nezara viridula TaxID=85310 RepID=A0A9P0MWV9_NEZVI|nr:unnamed protein product [Nezara viridula]